MESTSNAQENSRIDCYSEFGGKVSEESSITMAQYRLRQMSQVPGFIEQENILDRLNLDLIKYFVFFDICDQSQFCPLAFF